MRNKLSKPLPKRLHAFSTPELRKSEDYAHYDRWEYVFEFELFKINNDEFHWLPTVYIDTIKTDYQNKYPNFLLPYLSGDRELFPEDYFSEWNWNPTFDNFKFTRKYFPRIKKYFLSKAPFDDSSLTKKCLGTSLVWGIEYKEYAEIASFEHEIILQDI